MVTTIIDRKTLAELKKIREVKAVYLFGSHATGRATKISDVDLCVIADKGIPGGKKAEIRSCSSGKVDVSVFWDLPVVLRYRVLKEGKKLFSRQSEKAFHKIVMETIREYLDFKPVIKRFAREFGISYG